MAVDIGGIFGWVEIQDRFTDTLLDATAKLETASDKLIDIGRGMTSLGSQMTLGITVPLVAIGAGALFAAIQFETSFTGVRKTVTATTEEFAALEQGFRDMAGEIPISVNELNMLGESAGQLGIRTENILSFTETMAALGVTTNLSATEAAESLARLANITQMPQESFDRLGSTVVALGNSFATTEAEIVEMGLRLAGAGTQIGLTEGEILGLATAMSSVGINAEAGGSAFSRVMIDMSQAVEQGGDAVVNFAAVAGMSVEQFSDTFKNDASVAIEAFVTGLGSMQTEGGPVLSTLDELGFTGIRVKDSLLRLAGSGDTVTRAFELQATAWEENTALTTEAELRYGTTASKLTILKNSLNDVAITFGNALLPMLSDMIDALSPVIDILASVAEKFSALPDIIQLDIIAFVALLAAIGPVLFIAGQMITTLGVIAGAFGTATISVAAFNLALIPLAVTIGAIVIALVAANQAITIWGDSLDEATQEIVGSIEGFTDGITSIGDAAADVIAGGDLEEMISLHHSQSVTLDEATIAMENARAKMLELSTQTQSSLQANQAASAGLQTLKEKQDAAALTFHEAKIKVDALTTSTNKIETAIDNWIPVIDMAKDAVIVLTSEEQELKGETDALALRIEFLKDKVISATLAKLGLAQAMVIADNTTAILTSSTGGLDAALDRMTDELIASVVHGGEWSAELRIIKELEEEAGQAAEDYGRTLQLLGDIFSTVRSTTDSLAGPLDRVFGEGTASKIQNIVNIGQDAADAYAAFASGDIWTGIQKGVQAATAAFDMLWPSSEKTEDRVSRLLDTMEDGTGTLADFEELSFQLWRTLEKVAEGAFDADRAADLMNESFDRFIDIAREMGDAGLEAITKVVEAARASGVGLEDIAIKLKEVYEEAFDIMEERSQLLLDSAEEIISSLNTFVGDATTLMANDVQFAATSVQAAFAAMLEAGMPFVDIVAELGDMFINLQDRALELGVDLGDEFSRLGEVFEILANEQLQNAIDRVQEMGDIVGALGDIGQLTQQQFSRFNNTIANMNVQLLEAGLAGREALSSMAPELQQLLDLSQMYGFVISDNTQALIDEGLQLGIISDQGRTTEDILINGFNAMLEAVNALIVALGGIPVAFENWNTMGDATTQNFNDNMSSMGDSVTTLTGDMESQWMGTTDSMMGMSDDMAGSWTDTVQGMEGAYSSATDFITGDAQTLSDDRASIFDDITHTTSDSADMSRDVWERTFDGLGEYGWTTRGFLRRALDGIPVTFNVDDINVPPFDTDDEGFAHGSGGLRQFGRGTRAVLHGREEVITAAQGVGVAQMVLDVLSDASTGGDIDAVDIATLGESVAQMVLDAVDSAATGSDNMAADAVRDLIELVTRDGAGQNERLDAIAEEVILAGKIAVRSGRSRDRRLDIVADEVSRVAGNVSDLAVDQFDVAGATG